MAGNYAGDAITSADYNVLVGFDAGGATNSGGSNASDWTRHFQN